MSRTRTLLATTLLLLASLPARAAAPDVLHDERAKQHFAAAQRHFDRDEYDQAIPELKAAYAFEPQPILLYAWAQAERLAGNCPRAIELYREFLDTEPAPEQRKLAETNLAACGVSPEVDEPPPPPPPSDGGQPPADRPTPGPREQASVRPWYRDPWGASLVGVGTGMTVTGVVVFSLGRHEADIAPQAGNELGYFQRSHRAHRENTAGAVMLGVGGALLVAGVVRWAVLGTRGRKRKTAMGLAPGSRGFTLVLGGRF